MTVNCYNPLGYVLQTFILNMHMKISNPSLSSDIWNSNAYLFMVTINIICLNYKTLLYHNVLTIEHLAMFVVKSIHIQINGQVTDLSMDLCLYKLYKL